MVGLAEERAWEAPDVLVVGAGAAGLAGALAARRAGARVLLVAAGEGQSGMASGTWDLGTDLDRSPLDDARPLAALLAELPRTRPAHPLAARGLSRRAGLREVVDALCAALPGLVTPGTSSPRPLAVTELGLFRRPGLHQRAVLDLAPLPGARVAVARLPAIAAEFDAAFVATSLEEIAIEAHDPRRFVPIEVELDPGALGLEVTTPAALGLEGLDLWRARCLDFEPARERLAAALRRAMRREPFDAVLVPPMLGLHTSDARAAIEARLGVRVGEVSSALAGPQAARWSAEEARALDESGVLRRRATVRALEVERDFVAVTLSAPDARDVRLEVPAAVLATGKLVTAELVDDGERLREPLAGLPIHDGGRPLAPSARRDPSPPRAGVGVDARMRARGDDLGILSERLFACGALLDDVDVTGPGSGRVGAALTGWLAGRAAARHALGSVGRRRGRPGAPTIPRRLPASP